MIKINAIFTTRVRNFFDYWTNKDPSCHTSSQSRTSQTSELLSEIMRKLLIILFYISECARCPGSDFEKIRVNGVDKCIKPFIYDISNPIFNRPRTWSDSEKECQRVAPAGNWVNQFFLYKVPRKRWSSCINSQWRRIAINSESFGLVRDW